LKRTDVDRSEIYEEESQKRGGDKRDIGRDEKNPQQPARRPGGDGKKRAAGWGEKGERESPGEEK